MLRCLFNRFSLLPFQRFSVLTLARFNVLTITTLAFLWWRLIDHLRLEWTINPQYDYAWAVPFLCLYLAWQRTRHWKQLSESPPTNSIAPSAQPSLKLHPSRLTRYVSRVTSHISLLAQSPMLVSGTLLLLAGLWLPIRVIQEANPEWRLISWALAFDVIGLSLFVARLLPVISQNLPQTSDLLFPLCFILVAVPWPSVVEEPFVRILSRSTAALTCEALNLAGVPAVQQGNLVEVHAGVVGIEEACSGIRSFQASLMLALFFGGYYRLKTLHRLGLVFAGWVLALGSNIARTSLLAGAAAKSGMPTVAAWHDPVGLLSSVTCFVILALFARAIAPTGFADSNKTRTDTNQRGLPSIRVHSRFQNLTALVNCQRPEIGQTPELFSPSSRIFRRNQLSNLSGIALLVWLPLAEALTQIWYRTHESRLPPPVTWSVVAPPETAALEQKPLSPKVKQALRFDSGRNLAWHDAIGRKWQLIFLYWAPGRVAARLANDHTPAICLSAAGRALLAQTEQTNLSVGEVQMWVHFYAATDQRFGKVHVLYCIREDRSLDERLSTACSIWHQRLAPVLAGRRNCGQRSLELAVWGIENETEAREQLIQQMQRIVRIEHTAITLPALDRSRCSRSR